MIARRTFISSLLAIIPVLFTGGLIVYAAFSGPTQTPPLGNIATPITPGGPSSQVKDGGLVLNSAGANTVGFSIFNPSDATAGSLVLKPLPAGPIPPAIERLTLFGNLRLSGLIKIDGVTPSAGSILRSDASGAVNWDSRLGWVTLVGVPSPVTCVAAFPPPCDFIDPNLVHYQSFCLLDQSTGIATPVRVCKRTFYPVP